MSLTIDARSVIHHTFVVERNYPVTPERVFAALSDPAKKRRWFVDSGGQEVEHFEMDFQVGGKEIARFRFSIDSPLKGATLTNDGRYLDIVPNSRVVTASTMAVGDKRISASQVTFELIPDAAGTTLILTHQGAFFEGADGPKMREDGWRKLLESLQTELSS